MKRFSFNLESVLTLREFRKNEAAMALSAVVEQRRAIEEQLAFAHRSTGKMEEDLLACLTPSGRASEIVVRQNALAYQRGKVADLARSLDAALKEEEAARQRVLQAQREEETLRNLRKQQIERNRVEMEKEEERVAQEFVTARYAFQGD